MNVPRNTQVNTAIASIGSQTQRRELGVTPVQGGVTPVQGGVTPVQGAPAEHAPAAGEVIHLPSVASIDQSLFEQSDANDFNQYYNKIFSTKTPGSAVYESIRQKTGSGNGEGVVSYSSS
jgi:hypothetical protein